MESRCKGNCLEVRGDGGRVVIAQGAAGGVGVASGNRRMLMHIQTRDCLSEGRLRIEIRIGDAAVARPETGVNSELREIGEPLELLVCSVRYAAWQSSKTAEVNRLRTLRLQVCFQEGSVADLVIGIVVNILGHVAIKNLKSGHIEWIPSIDSRDFVVLDSSEL